MRGRLRTTPKRQPADVYKRPLALVAVKQASRITTSTLLSGLLTPIACNDSRLETPLSKWRLIYGYASG